MRQEYHISDGRISVNGVLITAGCLARSFVSTQCSGSRLVISVSMSLTNATGFIVVKSTQRPGGYRAFVQLRLSKTLCQSAQAHVPEQRQERYFTHRNRHRG
ncbi:hypothetical protein SISSUDRAFT_723853 [Sistotremastrum suecicum HHB10207 ss-3]|uniref:Uncharacterized protein n=1 Tax=Sistotremastrum suecicum HHB10207 ss-3 TaxID=1314776 RepID=A0A165WS47_9AGAM|nr:hypothetical protein SISSUDRAFT_723853 [Sistotremastrum suecicum HHB10207 ss-3]